MRERCDAFPEGIPQDILDNEVDHRDPFEGDHGVTFEPLTVADGEYAAIVLAAGPDDDDEDT